MALDKPVSWPDVQRAEQAVIEKQGGRPGGLVGLSFSGGGIRSATFNLGVLQALARLGLLTRIDYLSTVSGGGYIGGWFQAWFYREYFELRVARLEACRAGAREPTQAAPLAPRAHTPSAASLEQRIAALEQQCPAPAAPRRWGAARRLMGALPGQSAGSLEERVYALESRLGGAAPDRDALAREALGRLQQQLANHAAPRQSRSIREEPAPIRFLRDYSNYLTPKTGIFSADTWTVIVIYLRNLLLNALVLVLAGSAVLLVVRGLAVAHGIAEQFLARNDTAAALVGIGALNAGSISLMCALSLLGKAEDHQRRRDYVLNRVVLPLLVESVLLSTLLTRLAALQLQGSYWIGARWLTLLVPLLGVGYWYVSPRKLTVLRLAAGSAGNWLPLVALVAALGAGFAGAGMLGLVARQLAARGTDGSMRSLLGAPLVLCIIAGMLAVQIGITGRGTTEYVREWASRLMAHLLLWTALCLGIGSIALFGAQIEQFVVQQHLEPWARGLTFGWLATTVGGLLAARGSERDAMSVARSTLISITPHIFCIGSLVYLSMLCARLEPWLCAQAANLGAQAADPAHRALVLGGSGALAFAAALFLSWRLGVNEFSLHALYRNRLVRCYLGAVRGDDRRADLFTGFDIADDSLRIDELSGHGAGSHSSPAPKAALRPYLLINATLNLVVGQRLAWQFRRASSFVFSPLFSGYETRSPATPARAEQLTEPAPGAATSDARAAVTHGGLFDWGYRRTQEYGGGISLGTAMAISGAALSPNMGARTTPSMAFMMTLFNVRLGWWLGNPRHPKTWNVPGPTLGLVHLMIELLGKAGDTRRHVYLSDGGHFENLGLYELVRRRCRYVVVCDAGEDSESAFSDLGNAIEKCRVDFGVDVEIDVRSLQRDPETGLSKSHCTVGRIRYDQVDQGADMGTLLYIKSSLIGSEPADVRTYARANPHFPHQSTTDQWFDESQFESYRALGEHIALSVFELDAQTLAEEQSVEPLFTRVRQRHLAPARGAENAFSRHCQALGKLYEQLREDSQLSFLDAEFYPEWESIRAQTLGPLSEPYRPRATPAAAGADQPPANAAQLRAGFYFCQELIQLMESVYVDLDLEANHAHPDNRGFINLFHHWSWSTTFRTTWAVVGSTTGLRFQNFCERSIGLSFGAGRKRVDSIAIKRSAPCLLAELRDAAALVPLELSPREQELLGQLAKQTRKGAEQKIWSSFVAEVQVTDRRPHARVIGVPVALGVLRGQTLVFLRTRDHQRKAGLARDIVINLAREGLADDCQLGEDVAFGQGPSALEIARFERSYRELIREQRRAGADAESTAAE